MNELSPIKSKRSPKVIIASAHWPDLTGGIARTLHYLSDAWSDGADAPEFRIIATRGPYGLFRAPLYLIRAIAVIVWATIAGQVDIVHMNLASRGSTARKAIIALTVWTLRKPYVLHLRSGEFPLFFRNLPRPLRSVVRFIFKRAARVIVLGAVWRDFVCDELGVDTSRVVIMYNAVPAAASTGHRRSSGSCRLLFLGDVWAKKGIPELLLALAQDHVRSMAWTAILAGGGEITRFRAMAEHLGLGDRVVFTGFLEPQAIVSSLKSSDVLVLPSHFEGLPISVLEGMAYGLAVVSTTVGAIPEAIEDGVSGLLVPPGSVEALSEALARVIADPGLRQSLSRAALDRFREHFEIRAYASRMTALYRQCLMTAS